MNQSRVNSEIEKVVKPVKPYKLAEFDAYITYRALGGLMVSDDGEVTKMTQEKFCETVGVSSDTVLAWKRGTPNLAKLIRERRDEVVPLARETAALNQLFLLGMQTQDKRAAVDALKSYLGHHSGFRLPSQEVKHEAGESWAALIAKHQAPTPDRDVIDA